MFITVSGLSLESFKKKFSSTTRINDCKCLVKVDGTKNEMLIWIIVQFERKTLHFWTDHSLSRDCSLSSILTIDIRSDSVGASGAVHFLKFSMLEFEFCYVVLNFILWTISHWGLIWNLLNVCTENMYSLSVLITLHIIIT